MAVVVGRKDVPVQVGKALGPDCVDPKEQFHERPNEDQMNQHAQGRYARKPSHVKKYRM